MYRWISFRTDGVCVALFFLLIFTTSGGATSRHPYNPAQYTPRDPLNGDRSPHLPRADRHTDSQAILDPHNAIRARVGVLPLVWSDQLAQVAQDWANHLIATGALIIIPTTAMARTSTNMWRACDAGRGHRLLGQGSTGIRHSRRFLVSGIYRHSTQIIWARPRRRLCRRHR